MNKVHELAYPTTPGRHRPSGRALPLTVVRPRCATPSIGRPRTRSSVAPPDLEAGQTNHDRKMTPARGKPRSPI